MSKRLIYRGLLPALFMCVAVAAAFVAPPRSSISHDVLACTGPGVGCTTPTVTAVAPNNGPIAGGTSVTITGTQFNNPPAVVKFGLTAATNVVIVSDTSITATTPAHQAGLFDVRVTTPAGTSAVNAADKFRFTCVAGPGGAPVVNNLNPNRGVTAGGTSVVITGCGFNAAIRVHFGATPAASYLVNSDSQITAVSPAGTGNVEVRVATGHGTSAFNPPNDNFTYGTATCATANASAAPASPQQSGTAIVITATSTGCPTPRYQFWIMAPGGSWTIAQAFSAMATFSWNTTGLAPGTYKYSVWVRDSSSTNSYDAFFPGTAYTLTGPPPCATVNATAAPASPQPAGTTVTITATSTGCTNPRYEFWIKAPGGSWMIVQPYSATATFAWNTTTPAGTYYFSVWGRDAGSTAAYDAFAPGAAYIITTTPPCASVAATAAPASPTASGTTVTITATSTGCANPRYEFWLQAPGGSWMIVQAYSATATLSWNTTGSVAGPWHYSVWVRDRSSGAAYDQFVPGVLYTLTSTACTAVNATAAPASPQPHGTTITITATATGCTHPMYEFWIKAPGGSWTVVQAYSTNATFSWNTTGLAAGTYQWSVWVRDSGSSAAYEQFVPGTPFTLS